MRNFIDNRIGHVIDSFLDSLANKHAHKSIAEEISSM